MTAKEGNMKRFKFWWMMPWGMQPSVGTYFRIGRYVGKCIFKSPWLVIQYIPKGWGRPV